MTETPPADEAPIVEPTYVLVRHLNSLLRMTCLLTGVDSHFPRHQNKHPREGRHRRDRQSPHDSQPSAWVVSLFPGGTLPIAPGVDGFDYCATINRRIQDVIAPIRKRFEVEFAQINDSKSMLTLTDGKAMEEIADTLQLLADFGLQCIGHKDNPAYNTHLYAACQPVRFTIQSEAEQVANGVSAILGSETAPHIAAVRERIRLGMLA